MSGDKITASAVSQGLDSRVIGKKIRHYSTVTSTMSVAVNQARKGAPEGTVIIAEEQTVGRGRAGRTWISGAENLLMSIVLRPEKSRVTSLIMVASVAVVRTIKQVSGIKAGIKWPNDVLVDDRKICGILIENGWRGNALDFAVMGIGININTQPSAIPVTSLPVTSLFRETGKTVSRLAVARILLVELDRLYLSLKQVGPVYREWRDNLLTLGRTVQVTSGRETHYGIAESVNPDGSLNLRLNDGSLKNIVAGDVSLRAL